jgi:hypothetical protein
VRHHSYRRHLYGLPKRDSGRCLHQRNADLHQRQLVWQLYERQLHSGLHRHAVGFCLYRLQQHGLLKRDSGQQLLQRCPNQNLYIRHDVRQLYGNQLHRRVHRHAVGLCLHRLQQHGLCCIGACWLLFRSNQNLYCGYDVRQLYRHQLHGGLLCYFYHLVELFGLGSCGLGSRHADRYQHGGRLYRQRDGNLRFRRFGRLRLFRRELHGQRCERQLRQRQWHVGYLWFAAHKRTL